MDQDDADHGASLVWKSATRETRASTGTSVLHDGVGTRFRTNCTSHVQMVSDVVQGTARGPWRNQPATGQTPVGKSLQCIQGARWSSSARDGDTFDIEVGFQAPRQYHRAFEQWQGRRCPRPSPRCNVGRLQCNSVTTVNTVVRASRSRFPTLDRVPKAVAGTYWTFRVRRWRKRLPEQPVAGAHTCNHEKGSARNR